MATSNSHFIQIRDLRKTYIMGKQKVHALAGISLDIERNTFTVVMGPSGSGKSTLLYLLGGLDRPTSGKITIEGVALEKMDENELAVYRRKKIGFIFQSFNLVPMMNALENVAFPLCFSGASTGERRKRAHHLLRMVGLENRVHHKPTELSGGQQQRVAIARSMVNQPDIILADEPTGNLDTASGYGIMQLLSELHRSGKTVIVVTHDPRIHAFATHSLYLLDGKIVSEAEYQAASTFNLQAAAKEANP